MLKVTIDTNCLIDVDEGWPNAKYILELYQHHLCGDLELAIVGIAASENQRDGKRLTNIQTFLDRLIVLNLGKLSILKPAGIYNVTFYDWCTFGSEEDVILQENIHGILFPNFQFSYQDHCLATGVDQALPLDPKWLNRRCDVITLSTHISNNRDVFVGNDKNFLKSAKTAALTMIGAKRILRPDQINEFLL